MLLISLSALLDLFTNQQYPISKVNYSDFYSYRVFVKSKISGTKIPSHMDRRFFVFSNSPIATRYQTFFCHFSSFNWSETNNNRISLYEIFQIKIFKVGNLPDFSFYNLKRGSEIVAHNMNQTSFFLCDLVIIEDDIN